MNSSKNGTNLFQAIAKNAQQTTTRAMNQANALVTNASKAINTGLESVADTAANAVEATSTAITNVAKNIPVVNSMFPLNNRGNANAAARNNNTNRGNTGANTTTRGANNTAAAANRNANNIFENIFPTTTSLNLGAAAAASAPWWIYPALVFVIIAAIIATALTIYKDQTMAVWNTITDKVKGLLSKAPKEYVPTEAAAPAGAPAEAASKPAAEGTGSLLSKLLPMGQKEVFNVSTNDFTYYDAEPMCRALGAELATYDQVKEAWQKGADWCNYGWSKGQMAVYPTQKSTYEKLQSGPVEDQQACGTPGVNGGFFDNPEMRFGVNCYGVKPAESANDVRMLQEKGLVPRTPSTIKMDEQAQEYKERIESIGVNPFNSAQWNA